MLQGGSTQLLLHGKTTLSSIIIQIVDLTLKLLVV